MSNAVLSGDEEEQCLFTQPEADDLMVNLNSPKCKGTTQMNKQASKKKQHPDITEPDLDAQLKRALLMPTILYFRLLPLMNRGT